MLDLARFAVKQEVVVPIVDGWGQWQGRRLYSPNQEAGWYRVILPAGTIAGKASPLTIHKALEAQKKHLVYALGREGIPLNFGTFKVNGWGESVDVNFMDVPIFEVVQIVYWEDKRFYFYDTESVRQRRLIQEIKGIFGRSGDLSKVRGATPELRYYFILCNLQQESARFANELAKYTLSESERNKRVAEYAATLDGRLKNAIEQAGGTLVKYYKSGKGYMVEWELNDQTIKSTIRDDLRIINAGFCLSGYDKEHTLNSITHLAKMYQEDDVLNITRE